MRICLLKPLSNLKLGNRFIIKCKKYLSKQEKKNYSYVKDIFNKNT